MNLSLMDYDADLISSLVFALTIKGLACIFSQLIWKIKLYELKMTLHEVRTSFIVF